MIWAFIPGLISDGVMHLANAGVVNGRMKTIDKGKIVTGIVAGSNAVMQWAGACPDISYKTVDYTHDVALLGQIDNFVAINGAVEVDLLGQLNSEMVGGKQISGTGGSVDFMRGALRSKGGRGIVAFTATAGGGRLSRIVPAISSDAVVTALRTDADYFVTEYGVAKVRGQPLAGGRRSADRHCRTAVPRWLARCVERKTETDNRSIKQGEESPWACSRQSHMTAWCIATGCMAACIPTRRCFPTKWKGFSIRAGRLWDTPAKFPILAISGAARSAFNR